MDVSELLLQATVQTIDALSFTQSHVIDEDFRAHSKTTISSVRSLQREQRSRVEQTYGPRAASAETLAVQLTAAYRGETASLELAKEANEQTPSIAITSTLTHRQCHAFKKEMKQRIHEWERAFREEHGAAVTAHDKATLRHIYELYKTAKNRLKDMESPPGNSVPQNGDFLEPLLHEKQEKEHPKSPQILDQPNMRNGDLGNDRKNVTSGLQTSYVSNVLPENLSNTSYLMPASIASSGNMTQIPAALQYASKGTPVSEMSQNELVLEKRYLKRILHHFESEFEQRHGRPPTKNDRRVITREYTRYGELKNEIIRRSEAGNRGGAVTNESESPLAAPTAAALSEDV